MISDAITLNVPCPSDSPAGLRRWETRRNRHDGSGGPCVPEVGLQIVDARGQQRDLDFRGTGVAL